MTRNTNLTWIVNGYSEHVTQYNGWVSAERQCTCTCSRRGLQNREKRIWFASSTVVTSSAVEEVRVFRTAVLPDGLAPVWIPSLCCSINSFLPSIISGAPLTLPLSDIWRPHLFSVTLTLPFSWHCEMRIAFGVCLLFSVSSFWTVTCVSMVLVRIPLNRPRLFPLKSYLNLSLLFMTLI
jgi:hypothetical protein